MPLPTLPGCIGAVNTHLPLVLIAIGESQSNLQWVQAFN